MREHFERIGGLAYSFGKGLVFGRCYFFYNNIFKLALARFLASGRGHGADADTREFLGFKGTKDRFNSLVASRAAAKYDFNVAHGNVHIVMRHYNVFW